MSSTVLTCQAEGCETSGTGRPSAASRAQAEALVDRLGLDGLVERLAPGRRRKRPQFHQPPAVPRHRVVLRERLDEPLKHARDMAANRLAPVAPMTPQTRLFRPRRRGLRKPLRLDVCKHFLDQVVHGLVAGERSISASTRMPACRRLDCP